MKKTFAFGFRTLVALFVLLSGLFSTHQSRAQSQSLALDPLLISVPSDVSWKTETESLQIAKSQVEFYAQQGPYAPGTPNYNNQLRHVSFYKAVCSYLNEGFAVGDALNSSIIMVYTVGGTQGLDFTSHSIVRDFVEEAVYLLSN